MNEGIIVSNGWNDYELIDAGLGERLERWGKYRVIRPDPQAIWNISSSKEWKNADTRYKRSSKGGGAWSEHELPDSWIVNYKTLSFKVHLTNFKHTGLFPEQGSNWDWLMDIISSNKAENNILNLFGYTGAASVAMLKAGATVCHVDAAKPMLSWCKENASLSKIPDGKLRLINDDCLKFVEREVRRDKKYSGIVLDPPTFGRGANGEVWKIEKNLWDLLSTCKKVLADKPHFMLLNTYTTILSPLAMKNIIYDVFGSLLKENSSVTYGEVGLPFRKNTMVMPCGAYCRVLF